MCDGYPLSPSQELTLRNGLGERADGSWAATRIADFGPRQGTGKNDKIAARELAGLLLYGEQLIIHTAHEFPTANESFLRLVAVFENWDELRRKVSRIRYANGEQGIELRSGQRLKYRARTGGSGRGFAKANLVVYDEAQHLAREHVAASGPAKLANPNSQSWYAGSGGLASSVVAWEIRMAAILGKGGRLAYTEMTGEIITVDKAGKAHFEAPDPDDPDVWYRCIPGLGRWVTEEGVTALLDELKTLGPREILCVWDELPSMAEDGPVDLTKWASLADGESMAATGTERISLDASQDRSSAVFSVAGKRADNLSHVSVHTRVERAGGLVRDQVIEWALKIQADMKTPIILPPSSPAKAWRTELIAAGVELDELSAAEFAEGCGLMLSLVDDGAIRHRGQADMTEAVAGLAVKPSGDVDVWSARKSSVNIAPFRAATCALMRVAKAIEAPSEPVFVTT